MIDLSALYRSTLSRLSGERLAAEALARAGLSGPVRVLALGKAAAGMARGVASVLPVSGGVVAASADAPIPEGLRLVRGSHPVPSGDSEAAGRALLDEARAAQPDETVLFLVSGGGSAIAAVPAPGLSLADKIAATRALLAGGTAIEQTNAVRKHLSALKGGQLAAATKAKRRLSLVLCDVTSGDLASVASGPTVGDPTTYSECLTIAGQVLLPERVRAHLEAGARAKRPETPKPGDPRLAGIDHELLACPIDLARTAAGLSGEPYELEPSPFTGPVEALADRIVARVLSLKTSKLIALSGEVTVKLPPAAQAGGRMQHLALLLARALAGKPFQALCAGSDGRDGPTDHAGALVDGQTASRARAQGIDLDGAIDRFDSAAACSSLGIALPAFDSGTNLCDLVLVRVRP
ncbi:MAG TPA: DUF4147 domain-containing protein [Myxococcales bacterium]